MGVSPVFPGPRRLRTAKSQWREGKREGSAKRNFFAFNFAISCFRGSLSGVCGQATSPEDSRKPHTPLFFHRFFSRLRPRLIATLQVVEIEKFFLLQFAARLRASPPDGAVNQIGFTLIEPGDFPGE